MRLQDLTGHVIADYSGTCLQAARARIDADLPVEVWTRIAGNMSSCEWARVSGTCHSTLAVQLTNVKIHIEGLRVPDGDHEYNRDCYDEGALPLFTIFFGHSKLREFTLK